MAENLAANKYSPWAWVPTTFFMEGFLGVMTSIMYKNLGVPNEKITLIYGYACTPVGNKAPMGITHRYN